MRRAYLERVAQLKDVLQPGDVVGFECERARVFRLIFALLAGEAGKHLNGDNFRRRRSRRDASNLRSVMTSVRGIGAGPAGAGADLLGGPIRAIAIRGEAGLADDSRGPKMSLVDPAIEERGRATIYRHNRLAWNCRLRPRRIFPERGGKAGVLQAADRAFGELERDHR